MEPKVQAGHHINPYMVVILTEQGLRREPGHDTGPSKRLKKQLETPESITPTREDNTTFLFLKLPGEIRNMIYKYCLIDAEYSIRLEACVSKRDGRCKPSSPTPIPSWLSNLTAIVRRLHRVCPGL
jgi:hypothetical protein